MGTSPNLNKPFKIMTEFARSQWINWACELQYFGRREFSTDFQHRIWLGV